MYETSTTSARTHTFHGGRRTLTSVITLLGMVATAAIAVRALPPTPRQRYAARASAGPIQNLRAYLDGNPCDRPGIVALGERLGQAHQYDDVVACADAFTRQCGAYPRLQWMTYDAHRQRGDWRAAAGVASALIEAYPADPDYWSWRGLAHERQGALESAAHDYREAMVRMPWLDDVPFALSSVLERLDRPCEAIPPLRQFVAAHPTERRGVRGWGEALRLRGHGCTHVARHDGLPPRRVR